ncbi:HDIG domain-containing protein [bacterium]|nr:MAG: HDIG domain-containing protein [bacterium]
MWCEQFCIILSYETRPYSFESTSMNHPDKPLNLELLPGGAREAVRELLSGEGGDGSGELSPDVLEALAVDSPLLPPREPVGARFASYFGRHQLLLLLACFLALWTIVSIPLHMGDSDIRMGSLAPRNIVAPQNAYAFDREETVKRRDRAAALVTPAYDPNPSALGQAQAALPDISRTARDAAQIAVAAPVKNAANPLASPTVPNAASIEATFRQRTGWKAPVSTIRTLAALSVSRFDLVRSAADEAISEAYVRESIRSDVPADTLAIIPFLNKHLAVTPNDLSIDERAVAVALGGRAARFPNVVVNEGETERIRRQAREAVAPVYQRIESNATIIREGEIISPERFALLQELGLTAPKIRPLEVVANGMLCLMLVMAAAFFLARRRRDLLARPAALWLVACVPVAFLMLFRIILRVPHADFLMVPLAATAAMLVTVLLDARVGLPIGFVVAALCALMARADAGLFLGATLSAWIGSLSVANLSSRLALARASFVLAITNALLALALGALRDAPLEEIGSTAAWSALAGLASVAAMAAMAIFLERPFGITSHLRLLELMAPDETVIRRMQVEAPGTYTHSLMVATLSEAAAKAIGADSLLCRVAGLYHDIGKLRRPHCFIENQSGDNIHDRISPALSALLIKAHVKDGLELGRALRLPQPVLDAISSHHGKGNIAFFLARAKAMAPDGKVDERLFSYPGPRPQSREAAILMLADSVEASARSLSNPTPEVLATHIESIVSTRLREGELDECDLSLKDIGLVREAFANTLRGAMHGRIAYPDAAHLQGELAAPASDWVRQTLGEDVRRNTEPERPRPEKAKTPPPATPNKKQSNGSGQNPPRPRGQLRRRLRAGSPPVLVNEAPPAVPDTVTHESEDTSC